jgi:hypothetical protein
LTARLPDFGEIEQLVAYLPRLYADGFEPVLRWHGGTRNADGVLQLPYPEYDPLVEEFFRQLGAECWLDYDYDPETAWRTLRAEDQVARATLEQIKSMLTFCLRGERFADGHWEQMIKEGHIRRLLTRLEQLQDKGA